MLQLDTSNINSLHKFQDRMDKWENLIQWMGKGRNGLKWVNLIHMTSFISTIVCKNPLEETHWSSESREEIKIQYLDTIPQVTEWSLFVSKANHSIYQVTYVKSSHMGEWTQLWILSAVNNHPGKTIFYYNRT